MYESKQTDRIEHLELNLKTCAKKRKVNPYGVSDEITHSIT
jgi:hypothetical protein